MHVVICGGGVIGACTAYFLSRRGIAVTVAERAEIAAAASGKAGGFLALDWCAGTPLDALARRSFELHAALPKEVGADWSYRRMNAYSGVVVGDRSARRHAPAELEWLSDGTIITSRLGTPETTAIVPPRTFTSAMMASAQRHGARLHAGRVAGLVRSADGASVRGVDVDGRIIEADAVVIAMGPWSVLAAHWMALPAVFGLQSRASSTIPARMSRPMRSSSTITATMAGPCRWNYFRAAMAPRISPPSRIRPRSRLTRRP